MGLAAVAAWVAAFFLATAPSVGKPAALQAAYFAGNSARLLACLVLFEVGAALLIGFFVGLWYLLRAADPSVGPLAAVGAAGGVATQTLVIVGMGVSQLAVVTAARGGAPETVKTIEQGSWIMFAASAVPTVVFAAALGLAMLKSGVPGRWAGWLGLAVAALHVPAALTLTQEGAFALDGPFANLAPLAFMAWVVAACVLLLKGAGARTGSAGRVPEDAVRPTA